MLKNTGRNTKTMIIIVIVFIIVDLIFQKKVTDIEMVQYILLMIVGLLRDIYEEVKK